jgi:hypothetical protein
MASHELHPRQGAPQGRTVRVGWDAPLATFFVQVLDKDAEVEVVWRGTDPHEITEACTVLDLARPYALIEDGLEQVLAAEARTEGSRFAGRVGTALVASLDSGIHGMSRQGSA